MARTKLSRHELKEKDGITSSLEQAMDFVSKRRKQFLTGIVAVVVLAAAVFGWRAYAANRDASLQSQLGAAIQAFGDTVNLKTDKERFDKTIAEAEKVLAMDRNSTAGRMARYYIGMSQNGLGDSAKAIQTLEEVIATGDPNVKGFAQYALAGIHNQKGDYAKAAEIYKQLLDGDGYTKSAVLLELGKISEAQNKTDDAKGYYQRIFREFNDSNLKTEAEAALKRMGVTPEPPAPEPKVEAKP